MERKDASCTDHAYIDSLPLPTVPVQVEISDDRATLLRRLRCWDTRHNSIGSEKLARTLLWKNSTQSKCFWTWIDQESRWNGLVKCCVSTPYIPVFYWVKVSLQLSTQHTFPKTIFQDTHENVTYWWIRWQAGAFTLRFAGVLSTPRFLFCGDIHMQTLCGRSRWVASS